MVRLFAGVGRTLGADVEEQEHEEKRHLHDAQVSLDVDERVIEVVKGSEDECREPEKNGEEEDDGGS